MKIIKKIGWVLLIALIIAQFFGPERNEGDSKSMTAFLAETNPPKDVKVTLESACFDCHSNVTRYPWYNSITPVNYWLAGHVKDGKKHFNVSDWENYSVKKKDHKLDELIEEVEEKHMPLNSYTWTHGDANLSDEQISAMVSWAKGVRAQYASQLSEVE